MKLWFQHTAAETRHIALAVSTHSRLKAAEIVEVLAFDLSVVSTHSRLKAAERSCNGQNERGKVSTHSRLKAAETPIGQITTSCTSFNTQPPEGG